jgi:hypothetical protein
MLGSYSVSYSHAGGRSLAPSEPCSDLDLNGGRYWVRTSDLFGVNEARYHCANRPSSDAHHISHAVLNTPH